MRPSALCGQFALSAAVLLSLAPATAQSTDTPAPTWQEAHRFLNRATFGPSRPEVDRLRVIGYDAWLKEQFTAPKSDYPEYLNERAVEWTQDYFFQNALQAEDQLRQRVAFALHKIFVVSAADVNDAPAITSYLRLLHDDALDNVYAILKHVTLHPAMGEYLDMVNNDKADPAKKVVPNENYARELLQLFSIGLQRLNPDGTPVRDAAGEIVPAYTEEDVKQFTRALTGWTYASRNGRAPRSHNSAFYGELMVPIEALHDTGAKTLLNGMQLEAGRTAQQDLDSVIDNLYWHPNIAPFLSRLLIQQLVTSNPSPAYIRRVTAAFEDNGAGVRGDMKAIVRAILMDPEAMAPPAGSSGHLKEPALLVTSLMRAIGGEVEDHPFLADEATEMGQKVLFPPSVFSYFSPDYRLPGNAAMMGPEFQVLTSETALRRVNYAAKLIYGSFGSYVKLDVSRFVERAGDMDALMLMIDEDLLGGEMPEAMKASIVKAVNAQRSAENKARAALYLAGSSPMFQVVR